MILDTHKVCHERQLWISFECDQRGMALGHHVLFVTTRVTRLDHVYLNSLSVNNAYGRSSVQLNKGRGLVSPAG